VLAAQGHQESELEQSRRSRAGAVGVMQLKPSTAKPHAGAGRIQDLRRKAERRGLDPNSWFPNVEVVAAQEIARETVQCAANIYKYYVA